MNEQYATAICVALNYLEDRGWTELIDPREQALNQVAFLLNAKQAAQQIGK